MRKAWTAIRLRHGQFQVRQSLSGRSSVIGPRFLSISEMSIPRQFTCSRFITLFA
jgi:hypothetical protein